MKSANHVDAPGSGHLPLILVNESAVSDAGHAEAAGSIPKGPLKISWATSTRVVLHQRGGLLIQEASHLNRVIGAIVLLAAVTVGFLPWHPGGNQKIGTICALAFGGLCCLGGGFFINSLLPAVVIDPKGKTIRITAEGDEQLIPWSQILGLQECYCPDPGGADDGFQLNLVWVGSDGKVERECLHQNKAKPPVMALAKQYAAVLPFTLKGVSP